MSEQNESKRIKLLNDQNKYDEFILKRTTSSKADLYLYTIPKEDFTSVMIHYKTSSTEKLPLKFLYTTECKETRDKQKLLWVIEDNYRRSDQDKEGSNLELISEDMEISHTDVSNFRQEFNQRRIKYDNEHKNGQYFVNEFQIAFSLIPKYTSTKVEKKSSWFGAVSESISNSSSSSWKLTTEMLKSFLRETEVVKEWMCHLLTNNMNINLEIAGRLAIKFVEKITVNIQCKGFNLYTLFITLAEVLLSEIDQNFWEMFNLDENMRQILSFVVPKLLAAITTIVENQYVAVFWLAVGIIALIFKKMSEWYNFPDLFGGEASYERFFKLCERVFLPLTQNLYQHFSIA
eukprot:TCONS_00004801-protein